MERGLVDAKSGITKIVEKVSKGLIEDNEAAELLAPLRIERDRLKRILEKMDGPSNVLEMNPQAIRRFREVVEHFAERLHLNEVDPLADVMAAFRKSLPG